MGQCRHSPGSPGEQEDRAPEAGAELQRKESRVSFRHLCQQVWACGPGGSGGREAVGCRSARPKDGDWAPPPRPCAAAVIRPLWSPDSAGQGGSGPVTGRGGGWLGLLMPRVPPASRELRECRGRVGESGGTSVSDRATPGRPVHHYCAAGRGSLVICS